MKILKIILIVFALILSLILLALAYVNYFLPNISVKKISIEITPERVERGEYLANHVMVCMDCHSVRDWSYFSEPISPGSFGAGGDEFTPEMGFPGTFYAPNITPYNLKNWSDGEIYRAITSGVNKAGEPLFPVMPYHSYGHASQEDIYSVIAYIRTLTPIQKDVPKSEPDFPMGLIMHLMPQKPQHSNQPAQSDKIAYGQYLTTIAACADCHTPFEKGQPVSEMMLAGGREFEMPFGTLRGPNLTPDRSTGIGSWTEEVFVKRFQLYDSTHKLERVNGTQMFNTLMPWNMYGQMKEEDLKAIYAYLHSLNPVVHKVDKVTYHE